jgi:hypothetical protein
MAYWDGFKQSDSERKRFAGKTMSTSMPLWGLAWRETVLSILMFTNHTQLGTLFLLVGGSMPCQSAVSEKNTRFVVILYYL